MRVWYDTLRIADEGDLDRAIDGFRGESMAQFGYDVPSQFLKVVRP